jgi:hypothetical protein
VPSANSITESNGQILTARRGGPPAGLAGRIWLLGVLVPPGQGMHCGVVAVGQVIVSVIVRGR